MYTEDVKRLTERARQGDQEALSTLLRHIRPDVLRFCRQYLSCSEDAEEACQDVLLAVSKKIAGFEGRSGIRTWVHAIARNGVLQTLRRLTRHAAEQPTDVLPTVANLRTTSVIAGTKVDLLWALNQLEQQWPELVEAVALREFRDLKYKEIAELLGISIDTVKTHVRRGRAKLKALLAERHG